MKQILLIATIFLSSGIVKAQDDLIADILSTWDKHVEMNHKIIAALQADYFKDKSSSGGRNVADQFAHMHNVRMLWMSQIDQEEFKKLDDMIDSEESLKTIGLVESLKGSDAMIRRTLEKGLNDKTSFMGMSPVRFMGYLIAHEAHTRGQVLLALKQSGHEMPPQVSFGIWEW